MMMKVKINIPFSFFFRLGRIAPNGYRLCDPLPEGQILLDNEKKQWVIG